MTADLLGAFRSHPDIPRAAGYLAFCGALGLTILLQRWQLELRREDAAVWWASNGRDLINIVAVAVTSLALWTIGFPWASAVIVGATLVLALHLLEGFLVRWPQIPAPTTLTVVAAALMATPILAAAERVHGVTSSMVGWLFA